MRRQPVRLGALFAVLLGLGWSDARGQIIQVPTFTAGTPTFEADIQDADVAVGTDGTMLFVWGEYGRSIETGKAAVHRFSADGTPLGPVLRADTSAHVFAPMVSSDTRGGYIAGWQWIISSREYEIFARPLDGSGAGFGASDFKVDLENAGPTASGAVAGLPSGSVFVWRQQNHLWGRLLDTAGTPGAPFVIGDVGAGFNCDVDAMPDGGFVAVWTNSYDARGIASWGRVYAPDGQPRGPEFPVDDMAWVLHVAASPTGGIAATGYRWNATQPSQVWIRRFTDDGIFVGEAVIDTQPSVQPEADLAFDAEGDLYAVWSEYLYPPGQLLRPRARAYDAAGNPLGPPFFVTDGTAYRPRTARVGRTSFVNVWTEGEAVLADVVSLCTPGVAVCGDGVVVPQCEECDDGAANSDTRPDACRTDCRRARCGDGVRDAGEECDDGNTTDGDCCTAACRAEPDTDGDGVCDPSDNCRIFPNPDQTHPEVCTPAPYTALSPELQGLFDAGRDEFAQIEPVEEGLGPVFNGASCAECHNQPTIGGSSTRFVTRFGRYVGGVFDPMTDHGGSLVQARGITTDTCSVSGEVVPPEATVVTRRDTPPLFGLGLVDTIPDARILHFADPGDRNGDGISGRPNVVGGRVGRFGWKAQIATLAEFAADAYVNEMGVTSPTRPTENAPQGGPVTCDTVADPEDDGSNVAAFTDFMTLLAPLPPGTRTAETQVGRRLFRQLRCGKCHTDRLRSGYSPVPALRSRRVRLFSDLLLHDMGAGLADGIGQGDASGSEFRTAPLWGVARSAPYLHDGRAATLEEAITAHGGEGQSSSDRFIALPDADRAALVAYLRTL